jgi:2-C-methyl-D-erythritol 4-phosphate cytidylyltransferase
MNEHSNVLTLRVSVIIPAAGSGTRFGTSMPKQFLMLHGEPILARTLRVFQQTPVVASIVIAAASEYHTHIRSIADDYDITKLAHIVSGASERQHSVWNALQISTVQASDVTLVHDAVRPFCMPEFVQTIVEAAWERGAAIPGLVPKETIKTVVKTSTDQHTVQTTHERSLLRAIQTPQGFRTALLTAAYEQAQSARFLGTDDASLVERAGHAVHVVPGLEQNIKITTPFDFLVAEMLIQSRL